MIRNAQVHAPQTAIKEHVDTFEALAMPCLKQLYYTAIRLNRNRLDAEDLVQETYLKAWRFFHQFTLGTNFGAWIARILITNFINRYRSKKREPQWVNTDSALAAIPQDETSEHAELSDSGGFENYHDLFDDAITAALDRLPENYRLIVLLSDVNELSYKEIAAVVGCPMGTVMSRLNRGRKLLGRLLHAYASANGYVRSTKQELASQKMSVTASAM